MGDLESFSAPDSGGEGMDPAAFERFKERMAAAAAQIKALQVGEQKQRKKEDELIKILARFIKSGLHRDQMILVARLLELNVPAGFIVSLLLIDHPDIQQEVGVLLLPEAAQSYVIPTVAVQSVADKRSHVISSADIVIPGTDPGSTVVALDSSNKTLGSSHSSLPDTYLQGNLLPAHIKAAIDLWLTEISRRASENPDRLIKTVLAEGKVNLAALQLPTMVLRDFLEKQNLNLNFDQLSGFISLMIKGIIKKVEERAKKELAEGKH